MTLAEIEEKFPDSSLVANMKKVSQKVVKGSNKITPYTGAEMKKLETLCGGSALLVAFLRFFSVSLRHSKDTVLTAVIEATCCGEGSVAIVLSLPGVRRPSKMMAPPRRSLRTPRNPSLNDDAEALGRRRTLTEDNLEV